MSSGQAPKLYTPEILGLAVGLADYPLISATQMSANVRSRSCGSTLAMSLDYGSNEAVSEIGLKVVACAIGQASSVLFARDAVGRTIADIERAHGAISHWLTTDAALPDWAGIQALEAARAYPARHEAILMPWRAAILALSNAKTPS